MARIAIVMGVLTLLLESAGVTADLPELVISSDKNFWQTGTLKMVTGEAAVITVDENDKKQLWEGFGGTFNEMGWDALSAVSSESDKAIKLLFDAQDGANFNYGRIPIGASDYAMSWYTLAETANDYDMNSFSIARDRQKLIPFVKAALKVKPDLYLWGSPWNVPSWMTSSGAIKSDERTQKAHALYLARFVKDYAKEGLTIQAVHPQNEPGYAQVKWDQQLLINYFKKYMGPTFENEKLTAEVWCGTMSAPADSNIALAVARDSESMKYVKGFGLQWNHTGTVPKLASKGRVWQTEHRCGNYDFEAIYWDKSRYNSSKPQNDYLYAEESWLHIRDWVVGGVTMYSAWNMILDTYGKSLGNWPQNALLVVDRSAKKLVITPVYYVFRHFSQYIAPGATRLGTGGTNEILAFQNPDKSIITQLYNKSDTLQKLTVGVSGALYQVDLPAHSFATLRTSASTVVAHRNAAALPVHGTVNVRSVAAGYAVTRQSFGPGRIELCTAGGHLLESKPLVQGCREIMLPPVARTGVLFIRVVSGGKTEITSFVAVN